ncbi:MAG TPA: PQQ-binding-like beta-propeller repeat protein [Pirellulales bacterium]|nr:PQQ-binding-like beta-propeller repeat protein [Pirellulales bacterium]
MRTCLLSCCVLLAASMARGADWPQRNGPYRNNTTPEIVRPWTEPLVAVWTMPLGEGYSSPTVADGRMFLHHKLKDQDVEEVLSLDAATGKVLWRYAYPHKPFESNVGNGPRAAPCIALGKVYAFGITGILTCLEADTGKLLWQKNVLAEANAPIMMFGATAAPLVEGNRLYIPIGAPAMGLAALDVASGETIWTSLDDPPTSVMPVLFQPRIAGRQQVEQFGVARRIAPAQRVERFDDPAPEHVRPKAIRRRTCEVAVLGRREPLGQRLAWPRLQGPGRRAAVEKHRLRRLTGVGHGQLTPLDCLGSGQHRVVGPQPSDTGIKGGELPELLLLPIGERMIMALRAIEVHAQEHPRGRCRQVLGFQFVGLEEGHRVGRNVIVGAVESAIERGGHDRTDPLVVRHVVAQLSGEPRFDFRRQVTHILRIGLRQQRGPPYIGEVPHVARLSQPAVDCPAALLRITVVEKGAHFRDRGNSAIEIEREPSQELRIVGRLSGHDPVAS